MPASDFSWSPHRQPLCHGIKRKLSVYSQSAENEMEEQVVDDGVSVKRRCITLSTDISHDMNNMFEINHNDEQAYDLNNFNDNNNSNTPNRNSFHVAHQQVHTNSHLPSLVQSLPGPSSNHLTNVFVQQSKLTCTVISHNHHHQPSAQGDMIMDLNDETYSNTQIDLCNMEESSHCAMESDYVPNPEQYQLFKGSNSSGDTGSPDTHSMTNGVKSYCRPYWDTQDLRPYISDYY